MKDSPRRWARFVLLRDNDCFQGFHTARTYQQSQEKDEQRDHCRVMLRDSIPRSIRTSWRPRTEGCPRALFPIDTDRAHDGLVR
jgi:hypothetical protein